MPPSRGNHRASFKILPVTTISATSSVAVAIQWAPRCGSHTSRLRSQAVVYTWSLPNQRRGFPRWIYSKLEWSIPRAFTRNDPVIISSAISCQIRTLCQPSPWARRRSAELYLKYVWDRFAAGTANVRRLEIKPATRYLDLDWNSVVMWSLVLVENEWWRSLEETFFQKDLARIGSTGKG